MEPYVLESRVFVRKRRQQLKRTLFICFCVARDTYLHLTEQFASESHRDRACSSNIPLPVTVDPASHSQVLSKRAASHRSPNALHALANVHFRSLTGKALAIPLAHTRSLDTPRISNLSKLGRPATHSGSRLGCTGPPRHSLRSASSLSPPKNLGGQWRNSSLRISVRSCSERLHFRKSASRKSLRAVLRAERSVEAS